MGKPCSLTDDEAHHGQKTIIVLFGYSLALSIPSRLFTRTPNLMCRNIPFEDDKTVIGARSVEVILSVDIVGFHRHSFLVF